MKKIQIFLIIFFTNSSFVFSQGTEHNLEKYWYYRQRLKNQFMVVSANNEQGTNIPAIDRKGVWNNTYNTLYASKLAWGDDNGNLPYYIGMLATEYRLLKDYGQDYNETLNELVYALRAIERIDKYAEKNFRADGTVHSNDLNGFFIRDDVPINLTALYQNNHNFKNISGELLDVQSDYNIEPFKEMSQDNVWHYLMGLALIRKLVDDKQLFQDATGESVTVNKWAKKIAYRMVSGMHQNLSLGGIIVPSTNCVWWKVMLGLCFETLTFDIKYWAVINKAGILPHTVSEGYNPSVSCAGFANAGNWITEENGFPNLHHGTSNLWEPLFTQAVATDHTMTDTEIPLNIVIPEMAFGVYFPQFARNLLSEISNWTMTVKARDPYMESALIAIIGNSLFQKYNTGKNAYNHLNDVMVFRSGYLNKIAYEHFPLIELILHSQNAYETDYYQHQVLYESLLDQAPDCGPFNYGVHSSEFPDFNINWASSSRLVWPENNKLNTNDTIGTYSGIDYMLLHNLYWLVYKNIYPQNRYISDQIPFASGLGTKTNPYTLYAVNKIIADNRIKSTGKANYYAMNEIELLPGFETEYGAEFQAIIVQSNPQDAQFRKMNYNPGCDQTKMLHNPIVKKDTTRISDKNSEEKTELAFIKEENSMNILIYPNPNNGCFEIDINDSPEPEFEIEIVDMQGKVVFSQRINKNKIRFDLPAFTAGIYVVHVYTKTKEFTKKMIINN